MRCLLCCMLVVASARADTEVTVGGYLEAHYQAHFQDPSNQVTNLRGFDNRSRTFTLSNVALDAKGERGPITARVVLQIGATPSTYYLAEPAHPGTGSVNASDGELWKYLQTATVSAFLPAELVLDAGIMLAPVGFETLAIKDSWNWSRSNLFFGLPFYTTGATLGRPIADGWTAKLHVFNGWNSVVDNNRYPSFGLSAAYTSVNTTAQILYWGGVERARGAPEGEPLRHMADAFATRAITDELMLGVQGNAGYESNDLGASSWLAGALYGKWTFSKQLYAAVRGDYFRETVPDGAAPIIWPTRWVASGTATVAYQPTEGISVRLEYRHDHADSRVFFGGDVSTDPMTMAALANRDAQDTATVGVTAWF